jgi:23S rRNA (uracil1939-C5)-methyltransferase
MKVKPPIQQKQKIELEVTGLSHNGAGVGKYEGFTVFVPMAIPGEKVRVQIKQVKKTYAMGELLEILTAHPERKEPLCPIYEECGGCQTQHISYAMQLEQKRERVRESMERIGGVKDVLIHPVLGMKLPWRYRNKVQVPFGERQGQVVAGFYASGSHQIVDMETCLIQPEEGDRAVCLLKEMVSQLGISTYNEQTHRGILRHVLVRKGTRTGEMMIVLVTNSSHLPKKREVIRRLREAFPALRSIVQNINDQRTNVILGKENKLLWGEAYIYDMIGSVRFAISPHSFFQVNSQQTEVLYQQVHKYAALTGEETIIDAYCGIGTIALYLAKEAKQVYGVEIVPEAIRDAIHNAEINGFDHVQFTVGAAEKIIPRWQKEGIQPDVVIVDPPRKGCDTVLLDTIADMAPKRLVYVSCNPATLARDAKHLLTKGYTIQEIQPVDMFPQTMHVECVVLMSRVEK